MSDRPRCPRCRRWATNVRAAENYARGIFCHNCQELEGVAPVALPPPPPEKYRVFCPSCGTEGLNACTRARYENGFPCLPCARAETRAEIASAPGCPGCGRRPHLLSRARAYARGLPCWRCARRGDRVDESLACDLAELVALTREHGWATRLHWREVRGGNPAAADRHWERLKVKLTERRIPHETRLMPGKFENARLVALVVELDHDEIQKHSLKLVRKEAACA